ncbi:MAG TPA: hypothetical protein VL947_03040, partial [Cytophagales bacterium]|nr:hypothetical protein [Cytophagales bacterium]
NISSPADVVMGTVVGYKTSGIFHLRTFATPGELNKICYIDIAVYSSSLQTRYTYKHTIINNCN